MLRLFVRWVEIDLAQNSSGTGVANLAERQVVELLFLCCGGDNDIIGYFFEECQHDGIGEDEENEGIECEDDDDFFPERKLGKPSSKSLEASFFLFSFSFFSHIMFIKILL